MLGLAARVHRHRQSAEGRGLAAARPARACVGLDNPAGHPRFTFGNAELAGGLTLIPMMVGMFAVSEILRSVAAIDRRWQWRTAKIGNVFSGMWGC
jgi:TctA family transporter